MTKLQYLFFAIQGMQKLYYENKRYFVPLEEMNPFDRVFHVWFAYVCEHEYPDNGIMSPEEWEVFLDMKARIDKGLEKWKEYSNNQKPSVQAPKPQPTTQVQEAQRPKITPPSTGIRGVRYYTEEDIKPK